MERAVDRVKIVVKEVHNFSLATNVTVRCLSEQSLNGSSLQLRTEIQRNERIVLNRPGGGTRRTGAAL